MIELDVAGAEPVPEPRRRRSRWYWGGSVVLLAVAIAVAVVGIGPGHTPHPPPPIPVPPPPASGPLGWVETLVDAPPRGDLAADETFTSDLLDGVTALVRDKTFYPPLLAVDGHLHPEQEVRLLFAADIADRRVAVLALRLPTVIDDALGRTTIAWLVGPGGASASQLVAGITGGNPGETAGNRPATPFIVIPVGGDFAGPLAVIGLAPPGCSISTATDHAATDFRDEPTGSYIARTRATSRPEYWRVMCGGTVREERPAPPVRGGPTEDELAALARAAGLGEFPPDEVRNCFDSLTYTYGGVLVGPPSLVWTGPLAGRAGLSDAQAALRLTVLVAPVLRGWAVSIGSTASDGSGSYYDFTTVNDPVPLLAIHGPITFTDPMPPDVVLAFVPAGTVSVWLVDSDGSVLAEAPVTDRLGVLPMPNGRNPSLLRVQAVDATGTALATVPMTSVIGADGSVNWDGPVGTGFPR